MIWSFLTMVLCVLSFIFEGGWGGIVSIVLFFVILWIDWWWWIRAKPSPKAPNAPKAEPVTPETDEIFEDLTRRFKALQAS